MHLKQYSCKQGYSTLLSSNSDKHIVHWIFADPVDIILKRYSLSEKYRKRCIVFLHTFKVVTIYNVLLIVKFWVKNIILTKVFEISYPKPVG